MYLDYICLPSMGSQNNRATMRSAAYSTRMPTLPHRSPPPERGDPAQLLGRGFSHMCWCCADSNLHNLRTTLCFQCIFTLHKYSNG